MEKEEEHRAMMSVSAAAAAAASEAPLLIEEEQSSIVEGVVDYKGRITKRSSSGGWRSASFIMGATTAERFAFYGVSANLITYLTGPLGLSTAAASENVNAWSGTASMLPLLGAFVADSYLGRYRTIVFSSILYILGFGLLTISVTLNTSRERSDEDIEVKMCCSSSPIFPFILFFSALYLIAIAQGGFSPCIQAFGADQFDGEDPKECKSRSSFFNWWDCLACTGIGISYLTLFYIQENLSWGLGYGIPCIALVLSLLVFLLGTRTYRQRIEYNEKSLFTRMNDGNEAKGLLKLVPIWCTCLPHAIVFAQSSTLFTKQGSTMDRHIGSNFQIPAASLQTFTSVSIIIFAPIYDRIFIPVARVFTGRPSGITTLQRIGCGMFISIISMVVAALIEKRRLKTAFDYGLVDDQGATIPMSIWWLAPQYLLYGLAEVFIFIGLQEFFYDQVPNELKSLGIGLQLSIFGVGNFLSSFLISVLEKVTGTGGQDNWFTNNINRGHLDYFYWLLVGFNMAGVIIYMFFAKSYIYNRWNTN